MPARKLVVADRVLGGRHPADALLLTNGVVSRVGLASELSGPAVTEHRYPGLTIVPGLRDAHFHPLVYAATLRGLTLKQAGDLTEVLSLVSVAAAGLPPGRPLIGLRLDDETLAERRLPWRTDLDRAAPDRPVLLHRYCGHIAVANTAALEAAGVGPHTPDPPGGAFDRDAQGHPTGVLRETAVAYVGRVLPIPGPNTEELVESLRGLLRLGLTSIGAIISLENEPWCGSGDQLVTLTAAAPELPLNLAVLVVANSPRQVRTAAGLLQGRSPRLRFLGVKDFADGSLGGRTAALRSPYADQPDTAGALRLDVERLDPVARTALELGGQVAVHAIGDRANSRVLDVFEELISGGANPADLRIEHASVLLEEDVVRMADLGVTASVQPAFLASETEWLERRLGRERLRHAYPLATLDRAGVPLAGGSDCPVEPPNPLWGIAAARDRAGLVPEERLDAARALAAFTAGAAAALREAPPLAPGSPGDFVVLDVDPLEADPDGLRRANVEAVWMNGIPVDLPPEPPPWPG